MENIKKMALILLGFILVGGVVVVFTGWRDWYLPVALHAIFISGFFNFFLRRNVVKENIHQRLFWQYLFCVGMSSLLFFYSGYRWHNMIPIIVVMGMLNGFGTFLNWKATKYSLSIQSLFLFLDDIIAVSLAWIVLKEWVFLTGWMKIGLIMIAFVIIRIIWEKYREIIGKGAKIFIGIPFVFFVYVLGYSLIWGIVGFLMKFMAVADVPILTFMLGWYGGALITVTLIMFFINYSEKTLWRLGDLGDARLMFFCSLFIMANTWFSYWSFQLAPLTVVQPVFFAEQMIIPALIGLFCFGEMKGFGWREWLVFILAAMGAVLVILGYNG